MADVIWRNEALDQLDSISAHIGQFDPDAADRISRELTDLGESLSDFPRRGRPAGGRKRELVTVPPYVLTYEVHEDAVLIISVRHGRRRPLRA